MDDPEFKSIFQSILNEKYSYLKPLISETLDFRRSCIEKSVYKLMKINTFEINNENLLDLEQFINFTSDNKCTLQKILKNKNACKKRELYILRKDGKFVKNGIIVNDVISDEHNVYNNKKNYLIPVSELKTVIDSIQRFTPELGENFNKIEILYKFFNFEYSNLLTEATLRYTNIKHQLLLDKLNDEIEKNRITQEKQQKLIDLLLNNIQSNV